MNTKEVKEFLRSIRHEQQEILHLQEMIDAAELELLPQAIRYDKDKVQVSPEERFSKVCAAVADYQEELGREIVKLLKKQMRAAEMIMGLDDEKERMVLRLYYLTTDHGQPLTWGQVAIRMNYFERHVKRIHGNALAHLVSKDGTK